METVLKKPENLRDWLKIYTLYLTAFPAEERKPFAIIRKRFLQGNTDVWCLLDQGKFAGFATTVNSPNLILLDYLAVRKSSRKQGVGSRAMALLLEKYAPKGVFVEIESTREECADLVMRRKRRAFYERAGMVDLGFSARVFGVNMDLLGIGCQLTFDGYRSFYRDNYSAWAAEHLEPME